MDNLNFHVILPLVMTVLVLSLAENNKNTAKVNSHGISEFTSSFENLPRKFTVQSKDANFNARSFRSRRNVEYRGQMSRNDCIDCSGSYTPFYSGQCFLCPSGTPGPRGPPGQQGIPGRDGRDGRDATVEHFVDGTSDAEEFQPVFTGNQNSSGGTVYIRWGRNDCPVYSELVYNGVAGGAYYSHKGSGSNYLCMPEDPIYDDPMAGSSNQERGYLYGAEYQTSSFANWEHLHDNNIPCSVCFTNDRPSLMMVPGRNVCPGSKWTKEYSGYLFSARSTHEGRTEFVCLDRNAGAVPRSVHNANGALFYPVEGRCGSSGSGLPCGPYVDGYELTCAVCSR